MMKIHLHFWVFKKMEDNHQSFLWCHWYPCFGLQATSTLGFKVRVKPLSCMLHCQIHIWCDTCWPPDGQHGSGDFLIHVLVTYKHWWDWNLGPSVRHTSELLRPGQLLFYLSVLKYLYWQYNIFIVQCSGCGDLGWYGQTLLQNNRRKISAHPENTGYVWDLSSSLKYWVCMGSVLILKILGMYGICPHP